MAKQGRPEITQNLQITGGFFGNSDNINIYGGSFTSIIGAQVKKDGFQLLQEHVASAAFHNSKQRVDPPRCHKNTREAILEDLFEWIVGNVPRETWIAWLNGAAGAGKSAICQSIAEICIQRGVKVAIATLAYQIIQILPEIKDHVVQTIETHPLIFDQSLETQLNLLIVQPLRQLQAVIAMSTLLFIIDGVDECSGDEIQMNMIRTIAELLRSKDLPLVVLFASRCENQLQMAFDSEYMDGILKRLPLDHEYRSSDDIRLFLDDKFNDIKRSHPFRKSLGTSWPPTDHVQEIVDKSSGQFIFASVVVKFLSMPSSHPSTQLDIIRGLRPAGRLTPFAQLDALYQHILSQVQDLQPVLNLLAYMVFSKSISLPVISHFFQLSMADTRSALAPLVSVINIVVSGNMFPKVNIFFRHASLPDFLRDESRSREYCINTLSTDLSISWFEKAASGDFHDGPYAHYYNTDIVRLLQHSKATPELNAHVMKYSPSAGIQNTEFLRDYLTVVRKMDFGDEGETYRHSLVVIARFAQTDSPMSIKYIEEEHSISDLLKNREREELNQSTSSQPETRSESMHSESKQSVSRQPESKKSELKQPESSVPKQPASKGRNKRRRGRPN